MTKIQTFGTKTRLKNNESLTFGCEIETAIEAKGDDTLEITEYFPIIRQNCRRSMIALSTLPKVLLPNR